MKRGTPDHPKVMDLAEELGRRRPEVIGYLELLWHFTAKFAPRGDIGRFSDARIEGACDWNGKRGRLIEALRKSSWIDEHKQYRLLVHDWHQHADDSVKKRLARDKMEFVMAQQDSANLSGFCPDRVRQSPTTVADKIRLPEPSLSHSQSQANSAAAGFRDMDDEFEEAWELYPAAGRTRKPLCQQCYIEARLTASHEQIVAPLREGGKWQRSKQWGKGYVMAFADYLKHKRWLESPEQKGEWD